MTTTLGTHISNGTGALNGGHGVSSMRPKTENVSSEALSKTASTSTALAHKRALVSQFEHDNLLSNLPALDNVVEHFVKAARNGGGGCSALSEHIAGVKRCQTALINTAKLVQQHVTQLMIARQQFDAQKFALHQHLSSITSLLTPEEAKETRVGPDKSNVLHPGCPISNNGAFESEQKPLVISMPGHSLTGIKSEGGTPYSSTFSQGVPINPSIKVELPFNNTYYNDVATYADNLNSMSNLSTLPNTTNKDSVISSLTKTEEPQVACNPSTSELIVQPYSIKTADCKAALKVTAISSDILSPSAVTQSIPHYPTHISGTQVTASNFSKISAIAASPLSATINIIPPIGSSMPLYADPNSLMKPFSSNLLVTSNCVSPTISTSSLSAVNHNITTGGNKSSIPPGNSASSGAMTENNVNSESVYFLHQVNVKKPNELDNGCSLVKTNKSAKNSIPKANQSRDFVPNLLGFGAKKQTLGAVSTKVPPLPMYKHHPPARGSNPSSTSAGVSANSKFGPPPPAVASKVSHSSLLKSPKSGSKVSIGFTPYSSIKQTKNYGAI